MLLLISVYHVSQFMSDDGSDPLLVGVGGERLIVEQCSLSVCDQAPVFHGPGIKIWESYLICRSAATFFLFVIRYLHNILAKDRVHCFVFG